MIKVFLIGCFFLCLFQINLNSGSKSLNPSTNFLDGSKLIEAKKKALFFNYTDLTHFFKFDLSVSIDPKNSRINRDAAIKCLRLIEDFGFQDAMSSIKNLSQNDISFILFNLYEMKTKECYDHIISFILKNCSLEFDRLKFESLPEADKKLLLLNLSMPIKMAKKCFEEWAYEKYDIHLTYEYLALSPVGLEYFLLLVLTSSMKYPEIDHCEVYSYRVLLTISKLSNDKRFSFSDILETSNEKFFLNLKSAFEKKYIK